MKKTALFLLWSRFPSIQTFHTAVSKFVSKWWAISVYQKVASRFVRPSPFPTSVQQRSREAFLSSAAAIVSASSYFTGWVKKQTNKNILLLRPNRKLNRGNGSHANVNVPTQDGAVPVSTQCRSSRHNVTCSSTSPVSSAPPSPGLQKAKRGNIAGLTRDSPLVTLVDDYLTEQTAVCEITKVCVSTSERQQWRPLGNWAAFLPRHHLHRRLKAPH